MKIRPLTSLLKCLMLKYKLKNLVQSIMNLKYIGILFNEPVVTYYFHLSIF